MLSVEKMHKVDNALLMFLPQGTIYLHELDETGSVLFWWYLSPETENVLFHLCLCQFLIFVLDQMNIEGDLKKKSNTAYQCVFSTRISLDDHFKFVAIEDCTCRNYSKNGLALEVFKKFLSAKVFPMDLGAIPFIKLNVKFNRALCDYLLKNSLRF